MRDPAHSRGCHRRLPGQACPSSLAHNGSGKTSLLEATSPWVGRGPVLPQSRRRLDLVRRHGAESVHRACRGRGRASRVRSCRMGSSTVRPGRTSAPGGRRAGSAARGSWLARILPIALVTPDSQRLLSGWGRPADGGCSTGRCSTWNRTTPQLHRPVPASAEAADRSASESRPTMRRSRSLERSQLGQAGERLHECARESRATGCCRSIEEKPRRASAVGR